MPCVIAHRALLTPGEVMQLPPSDELVLVSGLAPIRASKLRYFEDHNFSSRVMAAPVLHEDVYADRPPARGLCWGGLVRTIHPELKIPAAEAVKTGDALDREHELAPVTEAPPKPPERKKTDALNIDDDDDPPVFPTPKPNPSLPPPTTAYGINQGLDRGDDLSPEG
ncbi:MAG: conjugal transfer protein TraG [Alphaproteobacteria bacterium]|nr:conjugal transfer protein TraG [Alphaproteobacteria bacterium]